MSNQILAALAPALTAGLTAIATGLQSIVANPSIENVLEQGKTLEMDALDPKTLETLSIGSVAQEALNVINTIQAHVQAAVTAPTATTPATGTAGDGVTGD